MFNRQNAMPSWEAGETKNDHRSNRTGQLIRLNDLHWIGHFHREPNLLLAQPCGATPNYRSLTRY